VAIGAHSEQQEIEDGNFDGRPVGKDFYEFLLIGVCEFLGIRDEFFIDCVDLFGGDWDFTEEMVIACSVVGVLRIERDRPLVGKKDFPED
jgi:hypothetical protein